MDDQFQNSQIEHETLINFRLKRLESDMEKANGKIEKLNLDRAWFIGWGVGAAAVVSIVIKLFWPGK